MPKKSKKNSKAWKLPSKLIEAPLSQVPIFPVNFLPGDFRDFVEDVSERMQVPRDFAAVPLIIATATAIGNSIVLQPKRKDTSWQARPVIWGGIIGSSGTHKTHASTAILSLLDQIQAEWVAEDKRDKSSFEEKKEIAEAARKNWKSRCKKAPEDKCPVFPEEARVPDEPVPRRILLQDATQEKVAEVLADSRFGVLMEQDELSGFFLRLNQYRGGGDREFYLSVFSGRTYRKDRVQGRSVVCWRPFLNIYGSIQPVKLTTVFKSGETDGMETRFGLLVWPDNKKNIYYVDRAPNERARGAVKIRLQALLDGSHPDDPTVLRFSARAQKRFQRWYTDHRNQAKDEDPVLQAHYAKLDGVLCALCIVLQVMQCVSLARPVSERILDSVIDFVESYLKPHAKRVYGFTNSESAPALARRLGERLRDNPACKHFSVRDVYRKKWGGLKTRQEADMALRELERANWVRRETATIYKPGRPQRRFQVNPGIHRL